MPNTEATVLIVDDEPSVRTSLSHVLSKIGFKVRTAEDGNSAMIALRDEVPEILISDLNMPGMSGFELLREVKTRFPNLNTIAMSGAFAGDEATSGVAADAFYQKGSSAGSLLKLMENLPWRERVPVNHAATPAQLSIGLDGLDGYDPTQQACADQEVYAMVYCPECLRPLSQTVNEAALQDGEAFCFHCGGLIGLTGLIGSTQAAAAPSADERAFPVPN
jgi:CheY-like chemotaxis protein